MKTFIHIGYPKNFSSSLQAQFFSKHPEILHLGAGTGMHNYSCISPEIESLIEVYLKTAGSYTWNRDKEELRNNLHRTIHEKRHPGHNSVTISSEHLSFKYSNDSIDLESKFERLKYLFEENISFVVIIRNQWELLKSLWREYVRTGFHKTFYDFIETIYQLQDRNLYHDLNYSRTHQIIQAHFPSAAVHFMTFEKYRDKNGLVFNENTPKILSDLSHILEVSPLNLSFDNTNAALSDSVLHDMICSNVLTRHNIGNSLIESAEKHRLETWFNNVLRLDMTENEIFEDIKAKRKLIQNLSKTKRPNNLYDCNPRTFEKIQSYYTQTNKILNDELNLSLPQFYYDFASS